MNSIKLVILVIISMKVELHGTPEKMFFNNFDNIALIECNQNNQKITSIENIKGKRIDLNVAHKEFGLTIFAKYCKLFPEKYKKCLVLDKRNTLKGYRKLIWIRGPEFVTSDYGNINLNKLVDIRDLLNRTGHTNSVDHANLKP